MHRSAGAGLALRATLLVTLALMPLGIIAVWQADRIFQDDRERAEVALLAVTERAAARERLIIERAIGAAAATGNTAVSLLSEPSRCSSILENFQRRSPLYSFVGLVLPDGSVPCRSAVTTVAERASADELGRTGLMEQQKLGLYATRDAANPAQSLLVVATPVFSGEVYTGHMTLQIPHANLKPSADDLAGEGPLGLIVFNNKGEVLTSEQQLEDAQAILPADTDLAVLARTEPYTFQARSGLGVTRTYAVLPMVPGAAYAIGTWSSDTGLLQAETPYWRTIVLAGLMWLASLLVVFLIMQVLVIDGVQSLRNQFRDFLKTRKVPTGPVRGRGELFDLETDFRDMAGTILREEAELEGAVREKNVLLKEVHHRVKNNLQLINSIINMILRGGHSDQTKTVVRRLQDRVMAMASVHQSIYEAQSMENIDAAETVREIVRQAVNIGLPRGSNVVVDTDLAPVVLHPDQAMPLSLLVSEAVTNALKYVGGDAPCIQVILSGTDRDTETGKRRATLSVINTVADETDDSDGTGLGSNLVRAFASQLDGKLESSQTDGVYTLTITFEIPDTELVDEKSVTIAV
ncbi:sensor histidine kinase [uncultured Roseobacter sp.]|uniref:sensor histidine kinase n=1 Tax=uncultured Roseobacter sp. TaxID=114847 RepID=UPI0026235516|nr:sensor histidine kinase [uncultured Roseobacter sp.]